MIEQRLHDDLAQLAEQVTVSEPPIAAMVRGAARRRRTNALLGGVGVAAAVTGLAVAGAALWPGAGAGRQPTVAATPSIGSPASPIPGPTAANSSVAAGERLVGIGRAVIAVPEDWGTNEIRCADPVADTVIIDVQAFAACLAPYRTGVESVELAPGKPAVEPFVVKETFTIDGVRAQRGTTQCRKHYGDVEVCGAAVYLPTLDVSFRATSSTSRATLDRILGRIRVLEDRTSVPGYGSVEAKAPAKDGDAYADLVRRAGLSPSIATKVEPGSPAGRIVAVSPAPGTVLAPGATVLITMVAEPRGPLDEVTVQLGSVGTDNEYAFRTDAQLRRGATLSLDVGGEFWAFAQGRRASSLRATVQGTSVAIGSNDNPNYPNTWVARQAGRSTVTLTIDVDGRPTVIGSVVVTVR